MALGAPGDVLEYTVLKSKPKSDEAHVLLQKIHSLVKPIMRKHNWILPRLTEFFPNNPNLLGCNHNYGQKICIRLRPHHSPDRFMEMESLLGTMLHELTHNVYGPHDAKFWAFLDGLNKEFDELVSSGWSGEGFFGRGSRVGVNNSHNVSMSEAREIAIKKAEERMRLTRVLGKGGRLGGSAASTKGKRMSDILAEAAERRAQAKKACGADHSGDKHLPSAVQAEIDQAEADSQHFIVDLTQENDDEEDEDARDRDRGVGSSLSSRISVKEEAPSSDEVEIVPLAESSKRSAAQANDLKDFSRKRKHVSNGTRLNTTVPVPEASTSTAPSKSRPISKPSFTSAWTCPVCTFDNVSPLTLACEVCGSERPATSHIFTTTQDHATNRRSAASFGPTNELDDGWICPGCSVTNSHIFWSCKTCGTVKQSSTRG